MSQGAGGLGSGTVRAWRLMVDGPLDGALDMAVDRAILSCVADGSSLPTLRLYRWEVPTVSLGRFQPVEGVDMEACERRGFDVVRRPTGGRGVLHDDELTYSIAAGVEDGVPCGTAASYRRLCAVLAEAYAALGVAAELTSRPRGTRDSAACYLHATAADLSLGAAKLSGSAQVWSGDAVLQHGSFVISRDEAAEAEVFRLGAEDRAALGTFTATLESVLGRRPALPDIELALVAAAGSVLGVRLERAPLTERERGLALAWRDEHSVRRADRA
ncbi:MAG TPA: biotin/lipoate A/B protein ligase family protein [Coriobacteriia bacterium]